MPKFNVLQSFPYFHGGHHRVDYKDGEVVDIDDEEMIEVAIAQQWVEVEGQQKPAKRGRGVK